MQTIDEYLQKVESNKRKYLQHIRQIIHKMEPSVQESISYQMPTFKVDGHRLLYFAAFKNHISLFSASDGMVKAVKGLAPYRTSTGTIQVKMDNLLSDAQIKAIIRYQLDNLANN
jgi:uncharacterized protein YdhG (YjbR/CyaY superfamily)